MGRPREKLKVNPKPRKPKSWNFRTTRETAKPRDIVQHNSRVESHVRLAIKPSYLTPRPAKTEALTFTRNLR